MSTSAIIADVRGLLKGEPVYLAGHELPFTPLMMNYGLMAKNDSMYNTPCTYSIYMAMLVLPRLLAAMLVMPVLTLVMNLSGLAGMTAVMIALGFPTALVLNQLEQWLTLGSLIGGLGKSERKEARHFNA